jgi:hypothetical protein
VILTALVTQVNARKNSKYKNRAAFAFTPGYAVNHIEYNSRNKPHNPEAFYIKRIAYWGKNRTSLEGYFALYSG